MSCFKHKGGYDVSQLGGPVAKVIQKPVPAIQRSDHHGTKSADEGQPSVEMEVKQVSAIEPTSDNPSEFQKEDSENEQDISEPQNRREAVPLPAKEDKNLNDVEIIKVEKDTETVELIKKAILRNEFLRYALDEERLQKCVDAVYPKTISSGEYIIREGEPGLHLYVCITGSFEVTKNGMIVNKMKSGDTFGELAILYNTKRFASVKAIERSNVFVLDRKVYQKIMQETALAQQEANTNFLTNMPIFKGVRISVLQKVGNLLKKEFFQTGHQIIKQGDRGDKFYIIIVGTVLITKRAEDGLEEVIGTFGKGRFFGELALLKEDCRQATVTAQAPGVECLSLDRNNFIEHFGDLEAMKNVNHTTQSVIEENTRQAKRKTEYGHIKFQDLEILQTLGEGGFGRVELVRYKNDKTLTFALKYLKKYDMVRLQQQEHAFSEKMIMMSCDSDFICKLHNTYRDEKYLYFLMEVCLGGDLWSTIQKQKYRCFDEKTAKFMAACVIEAFDYLHRRQIIYRDLKPENLLLDSQGYVKLVDFGFAKILDATGKTFTFAGTPEYVAPEIILNRGHDKAADYWALGIFIHELIIGKPPFRAPDHLKTYNMIIRGLDNVELSEKISKPARMLIRALCRSTPADRLGMKKRGMDDVREHRWYDKFDWESLRIRKMKAPLVPVIKSNVDMRNFDKFPKDNDVPPDETSGWDKGWEEF